MLLSPSNPSPNAGEDVTLNCSLVEGSSASGTTTRGSDKGPVDGEVVWYRNMRRVLFDHRIRRMSDWLIHIRAFRFSDNGVYQCFLHHRTDPAALSPALAGSAALSPAEGSYYREEWLHGDSLLAIKGGLFRCSHFAPLFPSRL